MTGLMRIAICEDNKAHAEILKKMVTRWADKEMLQVEIVCYESAEEFLFYMKDDQHYDLAFLDIQLEKMNGMELARLIRKEDKTMFLVFTTGEKGYALKGYEVSAFRYLVKPLREQDVANALTRINQMLEDTKKDAMIISCNDELRRISKGEIYYVEVDNHHIVLHMKREIIRFRAKMKEFETQFEEPQFCKCHRSYIVNLHYVASISKEGLELEHGVKLPISRNRWEALNKCYMSYYAKR